MPNCKIEIILCLLSSATVFLAFACLMGLYKAMGLKLLIACIASLLFWVPCALNFHDAGATLNSAAGRPTSRAGLNFALLLHCLSDQPLTYTGFRDSAVPRPLTHFALSKARPPDNQQHTAGLRLRRLACRQKHPAAAV